MDVQSSASRAHCPEEGHGKLSIHYAADLETIFAKLSLQISSVFTEQSRRFVKSMTLHERTVRPVVMGQSSSSLVLSEIKTETPLDCDNPSNKDLSIAAMWRTN